MIQSMKLRGALMVLLSTVVAPTGALAEARWCVWTNATDVIPGMPGTLRCYADLPCPTGSECTEGRICADGFCVPVCTSIRLSTDQDDCDESSAFSVRTGTPPNIETDRGEFNPTMVCRSNFARYACGDDWHEWELAYIQPEDTFLGAYPQHTSAWGAVDSDRDGCIDGRDTVPCAPDSYPCATTTPLPPSCGARASIGAPSGTCCISGGGVTCDSACMVEGQCSTVQACRPDSVCWSCEPLAATTQSGVCLRVETEFSPVEGLAGYCLFPEFFVGCDMGDTPGSGSPCFQYGGAPELNFFEGDCDDDGCPNGYDLAPCTRCDGEICGVTTRDPRERCNNTRAPEINIDPPGCTNADASMNLLADAGATSQTDANINPLMDAGARPTFGGGGGCTCTVSSNASSNASPRMALLAVGLALVVVKRRRRAAR